MNSALESPWMNTDFWKTPVLYGRASNPDSGKRRHQWNGNCGTQPRETYLSRKTFSFILQM